MNLRSAFSLALVCGALLLGACQTPPPISVESAKAVIVQNETTKKHIQGFTDTNKKTQAHVKKVQEQSVKVKEESVKESNAIDSVIGDLKTLLGKKP